MKTHWVSLIFLLALALGSCGPAQSVSGQSPALTLPNIQLRQSPTQITISTSSGSSIQLVNTPEYTDTPAVGFDMDKLADLAKRDLAGRLKIDVSQIALIKTMEITWPDVSQGCSPSAGQILTKGRVYGYRIWLETNGENYIYRTALTGQIFLCPKTNPGANNPLLGTPGGPTPDYQDQGP